MRFELTREFIDKLLLTIEQNSKEKAKQLLQDLHPADIAEIYKEIDIEEAKYLYLLLDGEKSADVLAELEDDDREKFLKVLPGSILAKQFIEHMDSDDAADILGELSEDKQSEVLKNIIDTEHVEDIVDLLKYQEDTAGGLMDKDFINVNINWDAQTCIEEIRLQAEDIDEMFYVYVTDNHGILKGTLSLKKLITLPTNAKIADSIKEDPISVSADMDSEEVANLMNKYDLVTLPVVDILNRLIGRIMIDDVMDVMREEAERDYQMASGISEDVEPSDSVWILTRARLPWLIIGLIGGVFGAQVIGVFEEDLAKNAATAFFIPLIAAMGGNVGVQSSAIVVQGIASNTIGIDTTFAKILKEISVAFLNGIACAGLIFIYNLIFSDSFALTISVSSALFIVIIFASTFGTLVPLVLNRFKIDPALATGPFITTVNDIIGLLIYLGISRYFYLLF